MVNRSSQLNCLENSYQSGVTERYKTGQTPLILSALSFSNLQQNSAKHYGKTVIIRTLSRYLNKSFIWNRFSEKSAQRPSNPKHTKYLLRINSNLNLFYNLMVSVILLHLIFKPLTPLLVSNMYFRYIYLIYLKLSKFSRLFMTCLILCNTPYMLYYFRVIYF